MEYISIYRKYRPKNFDDFTGQKTIINILKNSIAMNKISHAYLFSGPRGTGKTSMAKVFAKSINCLSDSDIPCDKCESCRLFNQPNHPDLIEIDAASNNGVEEIRNIIDKVKFSPLYAKYKVYIIDEAHMMTTNAFNAFLKTLEEPPSHVVFILATTEPHKIISTILSRCIKLDFKNLTNKEIVTKLIEICNKEGFEYEQEALNLIAELSYGGMRDSLVLLDQISLYNNNKITYQVVSETYGKLSYKDLESFMYNSLFNSQDPTIFLKDFLSKTFDIDLFLTDLSFYIKDLFFLDKAFNNTKEEKKLIVFLKNYGSSKVLELIDLLINSKTLFQKGINEKNFIDLLFIKISNLFQVDITSKEKEAPKKIIIENTKKNEEPINIPLNKIFVEDDELLEIMFLATKNKLNKFCEFWNNDKNKVFDALDNSLFYLKDFYPVIVNSESLIFCGNDECYVREIENSIGCKTFLNQLNNNGFSFKQCHFISNERFENLKGKFLDKRKSTKSTTLSSDETLSNIKDIFKNNLEIEEE